MTTTPEPSQYVTPGHPTKAGAGYDCNCGECLHQRRPKTLAYDADANMWHYVEDGQPEAEPLLPCSFCGYPSAKHRQEISGDSYTCQRPECGKRHYFSIGD